MNPPPPVPFGDPSAIRAQNRRAIMKGFGLGCGGCGALAVGFIVIIVAFVFFVFSFIGNSDAVESAIRHATDSEQVRERLGYPIEKNGIVSGSVNLNNGTGSVDITIPISGPKGKGRIHAIGTKDASAPVWNFTTLQFTLKGSSEKFDLLQEASAKP
jgi:hypothetical protein